MRTCPHCEQPSLSSWRVYFSPGKLACPRCGGAAKAAMVPTSFAGRITYLLAISAGLVAVFQGFGRPSKFFWPLLASLVLAINGVQLYFIHSRPLFAVPASPAQQRKFWAWATSPQGRSKVLRSTLILVAFAAWLFVVVLAANYLKGLGQ